MHKMHKTLGRLDLVGESVKYKVAIRGIVPDTIATPTFTLSIVYLSRRYPHDP